MPMRIALISDTHGQLDGRLHRLFEGVDEILHAGDITQPAILDELATIAPVHAVRGNCDHGETALLPEVLIRQYEGLTVLVTHILARPQRPRATVLSQVEASGAGLVLYGHTHRYGDVQRGGVRYINPGRAGAPRHGLPATVAILEVGDEPTCTSLDLDGEAVA